MSESFVYKWIDKGRDMYYIGSHKGTIVDGYICSSNWMLEEYSLRPNDFTREILAEGEHSDIRNKEANLLDELDVKNDPKSYNQHNGNGDFYLKRHTEETKKKISLKHTGKKFSESTKAKMSLAKENYQPWNVGIPQSLEAKEKNRQAHLGKKHSSTSIEKMKQIKKGTNLGEKNPMFGKTPWNKGKKTGQIPWNKGVKLS